MTKEKRVRRSPVEYRGTGFYVGLVAILVVALVLLIVSVQNTQDVTVTLLNWEFEVPLFGVAIATAIVAVILDELVGLMWRRRRRARLTEQAELESLRSTAELSGREAEGQGSHLVTNEDGGTHADQVGSNGIHDEHQGDQDHK